MTSWSALAFALLALSGPAPAEPPPVLLLHGEWQLRRGDDAAWAHTAWSAADAVPVEVPGPWEAALPGHDGYGWYRHEVRLPAAMAEGPLGLRLGSVGDAFQAYWNGVPLGGRGHFPPDFVEGVTPALLLVPQRALDAGRDGVHVLTVRVYNQYAYGGLLGGARIGRYDALASIDQPREMTIAALAALLLAIGAYHLAFFLGRRRGRENLYFAALCALAALYGASSGVTFAEATIEVVNPYRVRLLAMCAAAPIYLALLARLLELRLGRSARASMLVFALLVPVVAALPLAALADLNRWISAGVGAGMACTTAWAWLRGDQRGPTARVLLAGIAVFSLAFGWDLMSEYEIVPVARLLPGVPGLFWIGFVALLGAVGTQTAMRFARAEADARTDTLTGLVRRHVFEEALAREAERRRRSGGALLLAVLDLDHFKAINDTHGHRAGDVVLEHVGRLLRHSSRNVDLAARLGGEEFAVLIADAELAGALRFTERFRQRLRALEVEVPGGVVKGITASVGVVAATRWRPADELLDVADRAMYEAKEAGRDRVVVAELDAAPADGAVSAGG